MENLNFIRIFDPSHIPEYLIKQIKDRDFTVEKFYAYQKEICTFKDDGQLVINPYNLLFVLVDEKKKVQGFVWGVVDILNGCLCINNYSIDRKFWNKGTAINLLKEWAFEIKKGAKLKKIFWITKNAKYCEKYGFTKSKNILYEYIEEAEENTDGTDIDGIASQKPGEHKSINSRTTKLSQPDIGGTGTASCSELSESSTAI